MPLDATVPAPRTSPDIGAAVELLELLTVADVAALLKVSKSWVYEHTRSRGAPRSDQLPHIKIGKYVRFDPERIRAFLARQTNSR
jgi:excisionase family DNA binding protein